jgi:hypothetical protein
MSVWTIFEVAFPARNCLLVSAQTRKRARVGQALMPIDQTLPDCSQGDSRAATSTSISR